MQSSERRVRPPAATQQHGPLAGLAPCLTARTHGGFQAPQPTRGKAQGGG